ncbi:hypothetical protein PoB_005357700 [Plakobranchus ocellatus]|uniref:Uncharacterized protein n=1 Tax=Plakobranchus ocellatus TaxID=259542 RepID=A0AAV4C656_9GAST|nr:hypothetical protein PoB_005357700 [Plakobranchus ocellatus]
MDIVPERIQPLVEKTERRFAALVEQQDIECFLATVLDLDFISPASLGITRASVAYPFTQCSSTGITVNCAMSSQPKFLLVLNSVVVMKKA